MIGPDNKNRRTGVGWVDVLMKSEAVGVKKKKKKKKGKATRPTGNGVFFLYMGKVMK